MLLGWGLAGLVILAITEAVFFPVPPDALLIPLAALNPANGLLYGVGATLSSVAGGIVGYYLGIKVGRPLVLKVSSPAQLAQVEALFRKYGNLAVLVAALTPIPYKVFTIAAGIVRLGLPGFIFCSLLGRGLRFISEGIIVSRLGERAVQAMLTNFDQVSIVVLGALVCLYILYRLFRQGRKRLAWVLAVLFVFLGLGIFPPRLLDENLVRWVAEWRDPAAVAFFSIIGWLGTEPGMTVLTVLGALGLAVSFRRPAEVLIFVAAILSAWALIAPLKLFFARPRPEALFAVPAQGYGFPSGHALATTVFAAVLVGLMSRKAAGNRRLFWLILAIPLLVGVSRLYLGVHYLSDVLGGWAAGVLVAAVFLGAYGRWAGRRVR